MRTQMPIGLAKGLTVTIILVLCACASRAEIQPIDTITTTGPCYTPKTLQAQLDRDGFEVRVTGESENSSGTTASVLFYRKSRDFIIVIRHRDLACVLVAGRKLDGV